MQQVIKKSHPKYKTIDEMCFRSKNLYNTVNYMVRQEFINNNIILNYYDVNKQMKYEQVYKDCMSQPANCTLRVLFKNWKSYFVAIKDWQKNPEKYLGMPRLPKYLKKDGRFPWMIPNNVCFTNNNGMLYFKMRLLNDYNWNMYIPGRIIQVRFIPRGSCYVMEVVYEIEIPDVKTESNRIASIDLGVDNLVTITNNIGKKPIIINGKKLKSINQLYNKRKAKLQSELKKRNNKNWSKRLDDLTFKRYCRVKNYLHNTSSFVIKWCVKHNIDTLIVGKNNTWKQNKKGMQNFAFIPYETLLQQLQYKCENVGIKYIEVNEAYTSGTSYLDDELPIKANYNNKRRIHRGLFQAENMLINADVNGCLQIMKKVFPNSYTGYGIEVDLTPTIINVR